VSEKFVESNQRLAANLALGLILWVFSVFLFHPLMVTYAPDWAGFISVLLVVSLSYYLVKAKMSSGPIFEYVSNKLTVLWMDWRKLNAEERQTNSKKVEKALKTGILLLVYLLYRPLLSLINPALAGLTFVLVLVYLLKIMLEQK